MTLEAVGAVDPALQVAGDRALRSERGELADRADEVVDAVRAVVVLAQAVAEGELVHPVLDLGEVLRQAGAERIEVHDDEAPVGVRVVREGVDGVAERRVVDEAAVPVRRAADLHPRKLRRKASARQDMPGLDRADVVGFALRRRPVLALSGVGMVPEAGEHARDHVDGGDHERRRAGVEGLEVDVTTQRLDERARVVEVLPAGQGPHIHARRVEAGQAEEREIALHLRRQEGRRVEPQVLPELLQAPARVGAAVASRRCRRR